MRPERAWLVGVLLLFVPLLGYMQTDSDSELAPSLLPLRAEEDYFFLRENDSADFFLKDLKYIPLTKKGYSYLTLGGSYRARMEHFTNKDYTSEDETYYSQRFSLHASLHLGSNLRVFTELYHGFTSIGEVPLESDELDFHQAFLEWNFRGNDWSSATLRLGRQEIGYGASRLVGIREGPNLRRSFDMARLIVHLGRSTLDLLYGNEVQITPYALDNSSDLFADEGTTPSLWGAYYRRPFLREVGKLDIYYLGFYSHFARFNDAVGEEWRHSIGIRSFGQQGRLTYNTELIAQFGELGSSSIFAYDIETDWTYRLFQRGWKPTVGIKIDLSSGDAKAGDDQVGTFNPLFVNPAIYSLAAVNTPANVFSLHPNLTVYPAKNLSLYVDYAFFYRTQTADGLYTPPRFLVREANGNTTRHIGDVFGLQLTYELSRSVSLDLRSSYFLAGSFLAETGDAENTFYLAPTASFRF